MSPWTLAAIGLLSCLTPCLICTFKGQAMQRLVALEMAGIVSSMFLLIMAEMLGRPSFYDIGLTMALLAFGSGLVFSRFLERWL